VSDDSLCPSLLRRTSTRTIINAIISAIISARDRLPAPDYFTTRLLTTSTNTRPTAACSTLGQAPKLGCAGTRPVSVVWSVEWRRAQTQLLLCLTVGSAARTPKRGGRFDAACAGWCKWASGQVVVVAVAVCAREGVSSSKNCLAASARRRPVRTHLPPLTRRSTVVVVGQSVSESVVVVRAR